MKLFLKILMYFVGGLVVLFGIGVIILSSYGGNSPEWKKQIEEIASSITGKRVNIRTLNDARLVPNMMLDAEYVVLDPGAITNAAALINTPGNMIVSKLQFSVPFWSIFFGSPSLQHFLAEDIVITGYEGLIIKLININVPKEGSPFLHIEGFESLVPFYIDIELDKMGSGYVPKSVTPFNAEMGETKINGTVNVVEKGILIDPFTYDFNGAEANGTMRVNQDIGFLLKFNRSGTEFLTLEPSSKSESENSMYFEKIEDDLARDILKNICNLGNYKYLSATINASNTQNVTCIKPLAYQPTKSLEDAVKAEPETDDTAP